MKNFLFIIFLCSYVTVFSQTEVDTLNFDFITKSSTIHDFYKWDPEGYDIISFVFSYRHEGFDTRVQFNRGIEFTDDTKKFFRELKPGDVLKVFDVYAIRDGGLSQEKVKFPEMKIFLAP